jgi:hypothetical protein
MMMSKKNIYFIDKRRNELLKYLPSKFGFGKRYVLALKLWLKLQIYSSTTFSEENRVPNLKGIFSHVVTPLSMW